MAKSRAELTTALVRAEGQLRENFGDLLGTAPIPTEKSASFCDGVSTPVHVANIVGAAKSVLKCITDIKLSLLLGDFSTMNAEVDALRKTCFQESERSNHKIKLLKNEVSVALEELEEQIIPN